MTTPHTSTHHDRVRTDIKMLFFSKDLQRPNSRVFQDSKILGLEFYTIKFQDYNKIPGLSRVCTNPVTVTCSSPTSKSVGETCDRSSSSQFAF